MIMAPEAKYSEKLEVVTKEIEICKFLTSNDSKVRKRGIASLKKWFREIGQKELVDEDDYNRIWNGLFYYVWMSDKPLVQEEAVECVSGMIHLIENYESAIYYIRGFFNALVKQWDRISHYRIDKFLMFVRRFLRQMLVMLKNYEWNTEKLDTFSRELYTAVQILPYSLAIHLNEIFNEEVAKVSKGKIPTDSLTLLLKGYFECIANLRPTMQVVNSITSNVFAGLTRQLKLSLKQRALCGSSDVESGEPCDDGENNENEGALDPRPGGVDVFLPFIEFDENVVIEFIEQYRSRPGLPFKAKNILTQIIDMFSSITRLRLQVQVTEMVVDQSPPKLKRKAQNTVSAVVEYSVDEISPRRTRSKSQKKPANTEESSKPVVESKRSRRVNEPGIGRKSLRIAERQKKVQFNLEKNTFQDISTYQKYIKLKPEIPFDGSKPSTTSILKPSAVSSPINPFYFSNGERKLKRKK